MEDRLADGRGRARGDVGIFTTMELVIGAILFARNLDRALERHPRWWIGIELIGISGRNLIFDPPVPDEAGSPWGGRPTTAIANHLTVEANFPANQNDADIVDFGNEIADAIAYSFKADEQVKILQIGRRIVGDIVR